MSQLKQPWASLPWPLRALGVRVHDSILCAASNDLPVRGLHNFLLGCNQSSHPFFLAACNCVRL